MPRLNLSQVLSRISTLKGEVATWKTRMVSSTTWTVSPLEDNTPSYEFENSYETYILKVTEMTKLKSLLSVANATNHLIYKGTSDTLQSAIYALAEMKAQISLLEGLSFLSKRAYTSESSFGYGESSKTYKVENFSAITSRERDGVVQDMKNEFAALNAVLEAANHSTYIEL
jgi:hypothetical protein